MPLAPEGAEGGAQTQFVPGQEAPEQLLQGAGLEIHLERAEGQAGAVEVAGDLQIRIARGLEPGGHGDGPVQGLFCRQGGQPGRIGHFHVELLALALDLGQVALGQPLARGLFQGGHVVRLEPDEAAFQPLAQIARRGHAGDAQGGAQGVAHDLDRGHQFPVHAHLAVGPGVFRQGEIGRDGGPRRPAHQIVVLEFQTFGHVASEGVG